MSIIHLTGKNFNQEVLEDKGIVLVDFFAEWCGPCKILGPVIQEISKDTNVNAKICKLDIDTAGEIASEYGVMSVPTIIVFKNGQEVNRVVGALPKDKILKLIN